MERGLQEVKERYDELQEVYAITRRSEVVTLVDKVNLLQSDIKETEEELQKTLCAVKDEYSRIFGLKGSWLCRKVNRKSREKYNETIVPVKNSLKSTQTLARQISELFKTIARESQPIETFSHWNGGIDSVYNEKTGRVEQMKRWHHGVKGVYNPQTCQVEWKTCWNGGVDGVYNPSTGLVEWMESFHHGVKGVYNPRTCQVEWKTCWNGGVDGVFNPEKGLVEWKESLKNGVAGVYNPQTCEVEWKTCWSGGVVGYYDHTSHVVCWEEKWHHSITCIVRQPDESYLCVSGFDGSFWWDEKK